MIQDGENSTPFKATEFVDGYKYKTWITSYIGTQNNSESGPCVCHSSMIFHLKFESISPLMLLGVGECTNFQCVWQFGCDNARHHSEYFSFLYAG